MMCERFFASVGLVKPAARSGASSVVPSYYPQSARAQGWCLTEILPCVPLRFSHIMEISFGLALRLSLWTIVVAGFHALK